MNKMKIFELRFLTLAIWTVSATAQSKEIFCMFGGESVYSYDYKFNVDDLNSLQHCTAFVYGQYFFDRFSGTNDTELTTQILEADKIAIKSIVQAGRPVYLMVAYAADWNLWMDLLNSTDPAYVDNQVTMLVSFVMEYKICGIIYENINIYYDYPEPLTDYVMKLTQKIKDKLKTLKVGLYVYGLDYLNFQYDEYFNYTSVNNIIDHYLIEMVDLNICGPITKKDGVNPIHSNDPNITSIEQICIAIGKSHMKKSNVFSTLQVVVVESEEDAKAYNDNSMNESYKQLCLDAANNVNTTRWCFDTTEMLYNVGQFVAGYTGNIMVREMEPDDYSGDCQCGKFIATNTIINGWQSGNKKSCNTFDQLKPAS